MRFANGLRPSLALVPPFDEHDRALVVIETVKGSQNKLKYEPRYGAFRLSHVLPVGMAFPYDFGFLPGTKASDGDPVDVLVLMDSPVIAGCIVPSRLIGVIEAEQHDPGARWMRNDRLLAVADCSVTQSDVKAITDLNQSLLEQVEAFFADYNKLDGKGFRVLRRRGARRARRLVELYLEDR
jgi:inorganic pyrophosphatase